MKRTTTLGVAALVAPALLAFVRPADTVQFAPAKGTSVTKTFSTSGTFELDDMSFLMNGEDPGDMVPQMEMTTTWEQELVVTDEYLAAEGGRPTKLKRSYDDIGTDLEVDVVMDMMGQTDEQNQTGSGSSELEGHTVIFSWDDEAEEYTKEFDEDSDGDTDLLEGLFEDLDLRALLPADGVDEGDEWEIDVSTLTSVLAPGGNLSLDLEMDGEAGAAMGGPDPGMMSDLNEILGDMLEGEASGKYMGTREVDGKTLGVIEIKIDINTARDMSEMMADMMGDELPEGLEVSFDRMDVEFTYEGGGTLLWDMRGGHAYSLELAGDVTLAMDLEFAINMGQEMVMEISMEMSGELAHGMTTEE